MILCYHAIGEDPSQVFLPRDEFAAQCAWLARHRRVRPLDEVVDSYLATRRFSAGTVAITFDDGYRDNLELALPVLRDYGLQATVFLVTGALLGQHPVDWITDLGGSPPALLSPDEVREMASQGVDFGAHSWSHPELTGLDDIGLMHELRTSREGLEDVLGRRVRSFAYPYGRHDDRVRRATFAAGYDHAFSLPSGAEACGRFAIPRMGVYRGLTERKLAMKTTPAFLRAYMAPSPRSLRAARGLLRRVSTERG